MTTTARARRLLLTLGPASLLALTVPGTPGRTAQAAGTQTPAPLRRAPAPSRAGLVDVSSRLPLTFEQNQGQVDERVKFLARGPGYSLFLTADEAVFASHETRASRGVLRMKLVGARKAPRVTGIDALRAKSNYFIGGDPSQWRRNVPLYGKVRYEGVYPGIDVVYYGNQRQLEYDFHVAPGVDPRVIRIAFSGARAVAVDAGGDVVVQAGRGEMRQRKPVLYQQVNGMRREVAGRYVMRGRREVGFEVGDYDISKPLIIDPVLVYSSYLGGASWDFGQAVAVDGAGYIYVTGYTDSVNFPVKDTLIPPPPYHPFFPPAGNRGMDVFVTKIDPAQAGDASLVYSTYLGGGFDDLARAIAVDDEGAMYVTGYTNSFNQVSTPHNDAYPVTENAFQKALVFPRMGHTTDAFVTKLSPTGDEILYSSYLGGGGNDEGHDVAVDAAGHFYITGHARSRQEDGSTPFPTSPGAFQTAASPLVAANESNAFVARFDPAQAGDLSLGYSTYLGGGSADWGRGIAVAGNGEAVIAGVTYSPDFPTVDAFEPELHGSRTAFVSRLSAEGTALVYSTYLGGGTGGEAWDVALDPSGKIYVTGSATPGLPTTPGVLQPTGDGYASFVAKLDPAQSGAGSLVYATYLGPGFATSARSIAVDAAGSAYVTGETNGPFPTTADALSPAYLGLGDAFVAKLNPTATALLYSTYLGGARTDAGRGVAVDADGNIYVTGETDSTNFPITTAFQPAYGGSVRDAFVVKIGRPTFMLSGVVTNSAGGAPVAGVTLTLGGAQASTTTTEADGYYSFTVSGEASYTVTPSLAGWSFAPASRSFDNLASDEFADFTATQGPTPSPTPTPPADGTPLPAGSRLKAGVIEVNADRIVQMSGNPNSGLDVAEDGVYRLTGHVNINGLLLLEGTLIEVTLKKALTTMSFLVRSGHVYVADIPPSGKKTLWRGASLQFTLDGLEGQINNLVKLGLEVMPLKVAGATVEIKAIKLHMQGDPGIEIEGALKFPPVAGFGVLTAQVDSLHMSKKAGLRFGGQLKLAEIKLGSFAVSKIVLKYKPSYSDPTKDIFEGEGDLKTTAFKVVGKVKFIGGALESVLAGVDGLNVPIPPGTLPVVVLTGGTIEVGGLRGVEKSPFYIGLSVNLALGDAKLQDIVGLKRAGIKYTAPATFRGSGDLEIFKQAVGNVFIGVDAGQPRFDVGLGFTLTKEVPIFIVSADLAVGKKDGVFFIAGGAKGIVQLPDGPGFPYDLLKALGVGLPFQVVSAEIAYRDDAFKAAVGLPIIDTITLTVKYVQKPFTAAQRATFDGLNAQLSDLEGRALLAQIELEGVRDLIYEGVDVTGNQLVATALQMDIAVLHPQIASVRSQIKALKDQVTGPEVKIATNFFLLPKEIIFSAAPSGAGSTLGARIPARPASFALTAQSVAAVTVPANAPKLILRLFSEQGAPSYALVKPDGSVITPESAALHGATFVQNAEEKVGYFVVDDPAPGRWEAVAEDGSQGPFVLDAWGANAAPVMASVSAIQGGDAVHIQYSASDAGGDATVSLYYDTDADGFNGQLIAADLASSPDGALSWNTTTDRVPSGQYYVYAVADDGANAPARRYAPERITVIDPLAPATPQNVAVQPGGENSLLVSWTPNTEPDLAGYNVRYSKTMSDGQIVTEVADAGAQTSLRLPGLAGATTYEISLIAYDRTETPDPSIPAGVRVESRMSLPSAPQPSTTGTAVPPVVQLTFPNGGETIAGDTTATIIWEVAGDGEDIVDQQVELSTDGGATYRPLALRLAPEVRSLDWDVPLALRSTEARLRISSLDRAGNEGADASDAPFTIDGTDSVPETPLDVAAPLTAIALSHPANAAGWHGSDVLVQLDATDDGSGVKAITYSVTGATFAGPTTVAGASATIPVTAEGTTTIAYLALDHAGNAGELQTVTVNIDKTAPMLAVAAPAGVRYAHTDTLRLAYEAVDGGSGVVAVTPTLDGLAVVAGHGLASGQVIDLLTELPVGPHTFVVAATDAAGNATSTTVSFDVMVTASVLKDAVARFQAAGDISAPRTARFLLRKLAAAEKALARGRCDRVGRIYAAVANRVNDERGRTVSPAAAGILLADIASLRGAPCP